MVFKKGEINNPIGNNQKKVFVDALHQFITRPYEGAPPTLPPKATVAQAMAHKLIAGALRDDWKPNESLAYMQEICDRAYGKPKQALIGGDEDDNPIRVTTETDQAILDRFLKQNAGGQKK